MAHSTLRPSGLRRARTDVFHAPATLAALAVGLADTARIWIARTRQRQALHELAERDDQHMLDDIGVTRDEALRAAAKRFWQP